MKKSKIIGTIIGILLFVVAIAGITYAFINWTSGNTNKVVESKCFEIFYEKGNDVTGNIMPSKDYTGGLSTTVKINVNSECDINADGRLYLTTSEETSSNLFNRPGLLNYQIVTENGVKGKRGSITEPGQIAINLGPLTKNTSAVTQYTIYVWVDYTLVNNSDVSSVYYGSISAEAIQYNNK